MKYFGGIYRSHAKQSEIIAESYDQGLEFRLNEFFYNEEEKTYDPVFAKRLRLVREQYLEELGDIKQIEKFKYLAEGALAMLLHALLHPKNVYKTNCQVQGK